MPVSWLKQLLTCFFLIPFVNQHELYKNATTTTTKLDSTALPILFCLPSPPSEILSGQPKIASRNDHSRVALGRPRAPMRHQLAQVRRVALHQNGRLRVLLLRRFTNYKNLFWPQADRRVNTYVFGAAIRRMNNNAMILKLQLFKYNFLLLIYLLE